MCGTAAGGFMCVIARLTARPFMNWNDTTPAPNVGTKSSSDADPFSAPSLTKSRRSPPTMAVTNKCLAQGNKSCTGSKATKERIRVMTLQEAKSIARHLGLTLRMVRSGDYRVNFRDGSKTTADYTATLD